MSIFPPKITYLDHASATPIDKKVGALVASYEKKYFANPSAIHGAGVKARMIIDEAHKAIAKCIFAHKDEIIFTGSGTESDALAILGVVHSYKGIKTPHILTSAIEHPAVLEAYKMLEIHNEVSVTYVMPDENGIINPKDIRDALTEETVLVSIMYANNEIGTVQPIVEIARAIRHFKKSKTDSSPYPYFHIDACQAVNYLDISNIEKLGVDLMSWNSSKIYGPKGVGALYIKRGVTLSPILAGGGQEHGLRSGTENTAAIAGFALAFEQTLKMREAESTRLVEIRDYGVEQLLALSKTSGYEIILNGDKENRLPNNINISISGITSELLVIELDAKGIAVSAKSACKSDEPDESYVISALRKAQGKLHTTTEGSLRISLGRSTKKSDIDKLAFSLQEILAKYKQWK